jgi:hypothetical protein
MKKITTIAGSIALGSLVSLLPLATFAQTTANVSVTATPVATSVSGSASTNAAAKAAKLATNMTTAISRADQEIARRITNLNSLSTRIGSMKNVSASEKTSLQTSITTEISTLTSLKAKIDADTVAATLKTDIQSITIDYRVYLLILPQGRIAAATDRVATIVSEMQQLAPKLSARISAAQTAGVNVTAAQSAYTDMQAKVSDASTQSAAALSETESLQPDQGNATIQASNTAAIKDAAAKIKTSTADLKAARADIQTILNAVKGTGGSTSASATTNTSVTAQ